MDRRDVAANVHGVLGQVDLKRMVAAFIHETDEGEEVVKVVKIKFEVCDTCQGRGKHVNPSIDSNGLTAEDFDQDPDFRQDYMAGTYDVNCYECKGERLVPVADPDNNPPELVKAIEDAEQAAWDDARQSLQERTMGY